MNSQLLPTVLTPEGIPSFTPEQLVWIDCLIAMRQAQAPHRPPGTDHPTLLSTLPGANLQHGSIQTSLSCCDVQRWPFKLASGGQP